MSLKVITLNIECDRHLKKVIPFLKSESPDVVCLQEVFEYTVPTIKKELGLEGYFFPLDFIKDFYESQKNQMRGILFLTNKCIVDFSHFVYFCDEDIKSNYAASICTLEYKKEKYNVLNTHFIWTADGKQDARQIEAWAKLAKKLKIIKNFAFCGDFNTGRNWNKLFPEFCKVMKDNLPKEITNTLDTKHHRSSRLIRVVDNIFSSGNHVINNVRIVDDISDHVAIIGELSLSR